MMPVVSRNRIKFTNVYQTQFKNVLHTGAHLTSLGVQIVAPLPKQSKKSYIFSFQFFCFWYFFFQICCCFHCCVQCCDRFGLCCCCRCYYHNLQSHFYILCICYLCDVHILQSMGAKVLHLIIPKSMNIFIVGRHTQ